MLALAQLLPYPGRATWKALRYLGRDLRAVPAPELRHLLGTSMALVFQDPASSLNPALRVGRQLAEVVQVHAGLGRREAMALAVTRLRDVQIAARHADPRTTTVYDRRRENFDRHAASSRHVQPRRSRP